MREAGERLEKIFKPSQNFTLTKHEGAYMKLKLLLRLVPLIFFLSLIGLNAQITINGVGSYATIQDAIDASSPGDVIDVPSGTYTEDLTIDVENLTINGPNAGTPGVSGSRVAEATVNGYDIQITVSGVTIDGMDLKPTKGNNVGAIRPTGPNLTLTNNIIEGNIYPGSACDDMIISYNLIQNTMSASNAVARNAIYADGSNASFENWLISNNTFTNVRDAVNLSGAGTPGTTWSNIIITENDMNIDESGRGINSKETNVIVDGDITISNNIIRISSPGIKESINIAFNTYQPGVNITIEGNDLEGDGPLDVSILHQPPFLNGVDPSGSPLSEVAEDLLDAQASASTVKLWNNIAYNSNGNLLVFEGGSIQDAIDEADEDNIIFVAAGTYSSILIQTNGLSLIGEPGSIINNGSPAITIAANNVTIDGFEFNFDSALDYAINVDGDYSGIIVKNCNFFNTDGGGVNPGLGIDNDNGGLYYVLAYENNDWGDASGPTHASNPGGTGVTITDYVIYEWEGLQEPIHSITGVSIEPTFLWGELKTGPAATIEYQLIISINSDLSAPLFDENVGTVLTYNTNENIPNFPLANNTKYYWQIIALDGNSDPIYESEVNFFTTVTNINISLYNPGHQMQLYAYDPAMFTWGISQTQGALKYYLQIKAAGTEPTTAEWFADVDAEIATPGSIDFFYDHQSNSWRNVNGLTGGTRYYWRVVAYYDDGSTPNAFDHEDRVVKYSQVFYFDTQGGAVKAYPSWPTGGATIYYLDPTFYWYTMQWEPGATFEVIYSDDPTEVGGVLSNPLGTISAGSNMYVYIGTDLDPSTQYYWQVETTYGIETNYSSIATFTTYDAPGLVPTAANPSYPTGGLEIYTTAPYFYWWIGAMNVDVNFTVEVSTDNTFGIIDFTFGPTTDLYVQGSGLIPGEYYYWRVKSSKIGYADVYSTTAEFSVTGGLNSYPVANWPVGNPTVYTNTPTLSWYMEGSTLGWFHYKVVWSKKDKTPAQWLTQVLANDSIYVTSDMNETFYTFTSPLEYGETYYWAVAAHDHPGGPYSDFAEGSFTIAGNDANILLTNPANNSIILTKSPTFYWYVTGSMLGVTHFRVTYSNTELFNANVETVVTTTTSATVNGPLTEGATYWWYVELSYDGGGTWENPSSVWKFTVDAGASAVMPLVGSPARGVTIGTNNPTLSWYLPTQSQSALSYEVELSTNPDFSNATKYDNIAQLNSKVTDLTEGEYYWRVRSKTSGSTSNYSNTGNFKVGSVTSVDGEEELPLSYSIEQNYPNPFNPTTTINYSLPEANFVTIKIYNMLGQEVKTLLSEEVKAGRHNVNWNGENNFGIKVSSGTYIYRITAGEFVQAKKMILLK